MTSNHVPLILAFKMTLKMAFRMPFWMPFWITFRMTLAVKLRSGKVQVRFGLVQVGLVWSRSGSVYS